MRPEDFLLEHPHFTTRAFASAVDMRIDSATRLLTSYLRHGVISKVTRGTWANKKHTHFSAFALVPTLLTSEHGYISFLSALQRQGVISQISQRTLIATTGHNRLLSGDCGVFEFLQIKPQYMAIGVEWTDGPANYAMATAEKALIDCLYVSSRRGQRFSHFPELDLSQLKKSKFLALVEQHHFPTAINSFILARFNKLWTRWKET